MRVDDEDYIEVGCFIGTAASTPYLKAEVRAREAKRGTCGAWEISL